MTITVSNLAHDDKIGIRWDNCRITRIREEARQCGWRLGDKIETINRKAVKSDSDIIEFFKVAKEELPITVTVARCQAPFHFKRKLSDPISDDEAEARLRQG